MDYKGRSVAFDFYIVKIFYEHTKVFFRVLKAVRVGEMDVLKLAEILVKMIFLFFKYESVSVAH